MDYSQTPLKALADGEAVTLDARGARNITVITAVGATATFSRVDSPGATAHTTGSENQSSVVANTRTVTAVDWPFYRVSVAGGSCRVAVV